jgi:hypothetical protein
MENTVRARVMKFTLAEERLDIPLGGMKREGQGLDVGKVTELAQARRGGTAEADTIKTSTEETLAKMDKGR